MRRLWHGCVYTWCARLHAPVCVGLGDGGTARRCGAGPAVVVVRLVDGREDGLLPVGDALAGAGCCVARAVASVGVGVKNVAFDGAGRIDGRRRGTGSCGRCRSGTGEWCRAPVENACNALSPGAGIACIYIAPWRGAVG